MTPASARPEFRTRPHWGLALVGTAVLYALMGWLALRLAIPPGVSTSIYPSAGWALASVLVFGWRMVPGVALGAWAVALTIAIERGATGPSVWVFPVIVAAGAAAQAAAGTWLVRRFVRQPLTLTEPRDIVLFFGLGAVLACFVSNTVAVLGLWGIESLPWRQLLFIWWVWGIGDTLGVLIGAPIALSWIGTPRADWVPRRWAVGLTLCVATGLIAWGVARINDWETSRLHNRFEHDAVSAAAKLSTQLEGGLHALEALHSLYVGSESVQAHEFTQVSRRWLRLVAPLSAAGWAPSGEIHDAASPPSNPARPRSLRVEFIEPRAAHAPWVGVDLMADESARQAIAATWDHDRPAASRAWAGPASLAGRTTDHRLIYLFQAVRLEPDNLSRTATAPPLGVVFVGLHPQATLDLLIKDSPRYLRFCLLEAALPDMPPTRLAGPYGCEREQGEWQHTERIALAGQDWVLNVAARSEDIPTSGEYGGLLFSLVGLFATAMLGALLLTVTGRTRRIEGAVNARTQELQREIAERERTELSLRESEQRFRNILNHVPIGVVYADLHGQVRQVNPRFCDLTGYAESELVRMRLTDLLHPDDRRSEAELTRQVVRGDIPMYRRQCRYVTHDARVLWVQSMVSLLRDPSGAPSRIVGVVEDITEHLRLAEAERAREVAEAANLAKSEFLSRMSHELRTPLNAMLGFAQLLELDQNHPLPDVQKPWVTQIQNAGWHLLDMINDVLDLSRIEAGTLLLLSQPLDLRELLASTTALVDGAATRREITITQDIDPQASHVTGDATRVKQILTNLLTNAVKYNIDGGRVHISTRPVGHEQVAISVTDTGLGMTQEQQDKLFQPFNRLGRERSGQEGTGIGLVISRRLAELMGGTLTVDSLAGQGSAFTICLPRALAGVILPSQESVSPQAPSSYHQRLVHYVEDNETNIAVMRGILANRPQVRLDVSITGLDGLAAIRTDQPDLVLLDMHLPDISGLELLRHLKSDPNTAAIPVVAVSADAVASQVEVALQAGAMRYLTKPVNVAELLALLDAVLDDTETRYR